MLLGCRAVRGVKHFILFAISLVVCWLVSMPLAMANTVVHIGIEDRAEPWSQLDGTGYVNDLIQAAFATQGYQVQFDVLPYARCKADVIKGKLVACATMSQLAALKKQLIFPHYPLIEPHFWSFQQKRAKPLSCQTRDWSRKLRVAYVRGYEYVDALEKARLSVTVQEVTSELDALTMLSKGRVDLALLNLDFLKTIEFVQAELPAAPNGVVLQPHCDFGRQPGYLAFSRLHPQGVTLAAMFDLGMQQLQANGQLVRLQQKWQLQVKTQQNQPNH